MNRLRAALAPARIAPAVILVTAIVASMVPDARADAPHVVWIAGRPEGEVAGRARRWQRRVARALESQGVAVSVEPERWAWEPAGSDEARVSRLARVETLVRSAHEARARLDQRAALRFLSDAQAEALAVLDVPGASAWYAEAQIALAVTAAEIGETRLADAALARAATLDPARILRAAEAPPDLVERARVIARSVATGPRGRFALRSPTEGATVWIDGRSVGAAPALIETSVGAHVLRVEAPGHRTWARLVEVLEGTRAPVEIVLAPEPGAAAAQMLARATEARSIEAVVAALGELERVGHGPRALWLVEASAGAMDRAVVIACRAEGCGEPMRIDVGRVESVLPEDPDEVGAPLVAGSLVRARDWLEEPIPIEPLPPPGAPWWEEPWPWVVAGVVVIGASAVGIGLGWPQPTTRDQIVVDTREPWE